MSGDIETPEQKSAALEAVKSTIMAIFLIVIVGYEHFTYIKAIQLGLLFDSISLLKTILRFFFSSACTALRAWLFSSASERVVARLRKNLFSHLVHQVKNIFIFNVTVCSVDKFVRISSNRRNPIYNTDKLCRKLHFLISPEQGSS